MAEGWRARQESPSWRALLAAAPALRCPVCGSALSIATGALRCERGHSFDIARQGYVNLLTGARAAGTSDDAAMVAARQRLLSRGHYAPIAEAVAVLTAGLGPGARPGAGQPGIVVDLAGGTGYYLSVVLDHLPGRIGICVDLSKPALRRAAAVHPRVAAVAANVWGVLPLADNCACVVMTAFGPRNPAETLRVLAADGLFVLVTPTSRHLREVIGPLRMLAVDPAKERRLAASMAGFRLAAKRELAYSVELGHHDLADLVAMGPSAYHVQPALLLQRVGAMPDPTEVTISVTVSGYRPASG